jgi:hypothetical protein
VIGDWHFEAEDVYFVSPGRGPELLDVPAKTHLTPKELGLPVEDCIYVKFSYEGRDYEGKAYPVKREVQS